jgi:hypothetical protein
MSARVCNSSPSGRKTGFAANRVTIFEDFGNGQTKLTFIGNETMENAKNGGQVEGMNQSLDKFAAVVAGLAQAK